MKVGIQMFSVREMLAKDPINTFETVASIGYQYWEVCQLYGQQDVPYNYGLQMPPDEANALLNRLDAKVIGAHLAFDQVADDAYLESFFAYMEQIGCRAAGLSSSVFPYMDMEGLKAQCSRFNHVGKMAKAYGIQFYYHNHFMEFQYFGDKRVFDYLVEYTDPDFVSFELDTFWAARGGVDPIALINQYGNRIYALHQKDFPKNYPHPINLFDYKVSPTANLTMESFMSAIDFDTFVEVGTGSMPIQDIIDAGNRQNIKYIILEQDISTLGEENSIRKSMEAFKQYQGIEWA